MQYIQVNTGAHSQAKNITAEVGAIVAESGVDEGWCEVFVPHTTAAVCVNEAADPSVMSDVLESLDRQIPWQAGYRHMEGNSASHIKSILTGPSVRLPVIDGRLALGTWQGIFFMEYDGPRNRKVLVDVR
jgi:secondary thiamine-phosphate synthase enzyme